MRKLRISAVMKAVCAGSVNNKRSCSDAGIANRVDVDLNMMGVDDDEEEKALVTGSKTAINIIVMYKIIMMYESAAAAAAL